MGLTSTSSLYFFLSTSHYRPLWDYYLYTLHLIFTLHTVVSCAFLDECVKTLYNLFQSADFIGLYFTYISPILIAICFILYLGVLAFVGLAYI